MSAAAEQLFGIEELSEYLGIPVATLYKWNHTGDGPPYLKIGRRVKYKLTDVTEWVNNHYAGTAPAAR